MQDILVLVNFLAQTIGILNGAALVEEILNHLAIHIKKYTI